MSLDKRKVCHELRILRKIQETEDAVSLVLEIPRTTGGKFQYKAGQFVTFFLDINGEEIRRSYSLASSPDYDTEFKIAVKLVPGGKGSTYLIQRAKAGDMLWVTPPAGLFVLPQNIENQKLVFYAGGSGITPIISLIKSALKTSRTCECVLLYQNRSENNIIFKDEIEKLVAEFAPRLKVEHVISKPDVNWPGLTGRADKSLLREFFTRNLIGIRSVHHLCGPEGFMKSIETALVEMNVDKAKIFKESFTVPVASPPAEHTAATTGISSTSGDFKIDEDCVVIGDQDKLSAPETIEATVEGENHTVTYKKDKTVLECLLDVGLNPPYSCLDGACMACLAKVEEGLVYQNDMGILSEDNIEARECLTCQARPASKKLKIIYETF